MSYITTGCRKYCELDSLYTTALRFWEAKMHKMEALRDSVSGEDPFPGSFLIWLT